MLLVICIGQLVNDRKGAVPELLDFVFKNGWVYYRLAYM